MPYFYSRFAALGSTLFACLFLLQGATAHARDGVPVTVVEARRMPIFRQVPLTGTVTSLRNARLSPATSGLVQALNVDAGSRVVAGDVLLALDAELAALQLESAQARAEQLRNALQDARRRLSEARELIPQRSIAETAVRDLEAEVAEDEAALRQAQAEAGYQGALLERHKLRAPFDGVVSARLTDLGEWVAPGQAVLELVATDTVRLDFPVAEDFLPAIERGGEVRYSLNASPGETHTGTVATVVPVTDPGARTFLLRVEPGAGAPLLKPGMSVRATLALPADREGLVVPRDATLRYPDGRTVVWTVHSRDGELRVVENLVEPGLQFDGMVEIRAGLEPGTRVVVEGNESLQAGQAVRIRATASRR
nr:efflux RND transporter periplasmic adaptor subunit [Parahaliea mediterranea]